MHARLYDKGMAVTVTPAVMAPRDGAAYLAVSLRHLRALSQRGDIAVVRIGRKCLRYRRADLDRFLLAHTIGVKA